MESNRLDSAQCRGVVLGETHVRICANRRAFADHPGEPAMISASSLDVLFAGPSPGIVAAIFLVAVGAAAAVLWTFVRLVVDPRAGITDDADEQSLPRWDETGDPAYDDGYAFSKGDGTG
jgi:hypothetical protein